MGRYINWDDVVGRYPDAAKIAGASAVGSNWLGYVESELDARIGVKYTVPFTPVPAQIADLAIDMVYYRMNIRAKGIDSVKKFIDGRLAGILNGTIVLMGVDGVVQMSDKAVSWSEQNQPGYHTAFGPDDVEFWTPSSAYLNNVDRLRD